MLKRLPAQAHHNRCNVCLMIRGLTSSKASQASSFSARVRPCFRVSSASHGPPIDRLARLASLISDVPRFDGRGQTCCQHRYRRSHASCKASSSEGQAVIVEGYADKVAIQRAVPYAVFVLGSSTWVEGKNSAAVLAKLRQGLPNFQKTYVLMDPDFAGRKGRNTLETSFPGQLWHAFIPVESATSSRQTRWHEAGNIGVEHASPSSIREALAKSRVASLGRKHFTRERLMGLGLTASFDDPLASCMRERRDMVCNFLGIGSCDGKQLLRQLNVYNFTDDDLHRALQCQTEESK